MPQPIANNILSKPISGSIERADMSLAIEGEGRDYRGNYSGLEWYSSITPIDGKYVIVSKSVGTGLPTHWVTADATDAELLYTVNRLPDVANSQTFNDTGSALDYLASSDRYIVLRSMPNNSDADTLVLSVDPKNLSSYPQTGTTLYDLSGFSNDGVIYNNPTFNSNGYFELDGVDDNIRTSTSVNSYSGSIEIIATRENSTANTFPINSVSYPGTNRYYIRQNMGLSDWDVVRGNPLSAAGLGSIDIGKFYHIVMTWDSNTVYGWKNGELMNTASYTNPGTPTTFLSIGAASSGGVNAVQSNIASVKTYDKTLSSDEIKQNYYGGPIVTDGLIFAIDPSNLVSYESGSTTTYSLTGSYTGSLQNGVGFRPDNGGVFYFDGGDDIISSQNVNPSAITVEVWKKWTTVSDDWLITNQVAPTNSSYGYYIRIDSPSYALRWYAGTTSGVKVAATTIDLNEWYHVVGMTDADGTKLYVNGELVGSDTGGTIDYTGVQGLTIGAANDTSRATPGPVGAVRIYDRALTAEEVAQNYNAQKQKYQS